MSGYTRWSRRALMVLATLAPAVSDAQGVVTGVVRDPEGRPVQAAMVIHIGSGRWVTTDSLGTYRLEGIGEGIASLFARRLAYHGGDTMRIHVERGRSARRDFVLRLDSTWIVRQHEVWLGCRAPSATMDCVRPSRIGPWYGFADAGVWVFRDSLPFHRFWQERRARQPRQMDPPEVDWGREAIIAVSYGGHSGCAPQLYVNRVERRSDTTLVVVGPDTLFEGAMRITCAAFWETADVLTVPWSPQLVVVRPAHVQWRAPPPLREVP